MDRFNHSVNERITADDMNRPGLIATKGVLRDFFGPLTSGGLDGFTTAELDQGILFGLDVTTPGAVKTVDVSPGTWLGFDAAIVNLYDNPRTMGRKEVAETAIPIADATATFEKLYLISVPTQRASLEANADTETRDIKNPTTGVLSTQSVAKRITPVLTAVTVTAGTEVTPIGTIDLTDTPTHDKWTGADGIDTHGPALPAGHIPVAIIYKDDAANIVAADIHDARQMSSIRGALDVQIHNSAVYPKSAEDLVPNLGLAKCVGVFQGAGTSDPTVEVEANILSISRTALGEYTVIMNKPFAAAFSYGVHCMFHVATADRRHFTVETSSATTFIIQIMDETGTQVDAAAGERVSFTAFGAQ